MNNLTLKHLATVALALLLWLPVSAKTAQTLPAGTKHTMFFHPLNAGWLIAGMSGFDIYTEAGDPASLKIYASTSYYSTPITSSVNNDGTTVSADQPANERLYIVTPPVSGEVTLQYRKYATYNPGKTGVEVFKMKKNADGSWSKDGEALLSKSEVNGDTFSSSYGQYDNASFTVPADTRLGLYIANAEVTQLQWPATEAFELPLITSAYFPGSSDMALDETGKATNTISLDIKNLGYYNYAENDLTYDIYLRSTGTKIGSWTCPAALNAGASLSSYRAADIELDFAALAQDPNFLPGNGDYLDFLPVGVPNPIPGTSGASCRIYPYSYALNIIDNNSSELNYSKELNIGKVGPSGTYRGLRFENVSSRDLTIDEVTTADGSALPSCLKLTTRTNNNGVQVKDGLFRLPLNFVGRATSSYDGTTNNVDLELAVEPGMVGPWEETIRFHILGTDEYLTWKVKADVVDPAVNYFENFDFFQDGYAWIEPAGWTNPSTTWKANSDYYGRSVVLFNEKYISTYGSSDDYTPDRIIMPPLSGGELSFYYKGGGTYGYNGLQVLFSTDMQTWTPLLTMLGSMQYKLDFAATVPDSDIRVIEDSSNYNKYSVTIPEGGGYIAFDGVSVYLDEITAPPLRLTANEMKTVKLNYPVMADVNSAMPLSATLRNMGSTVYDDYTVELLCNGEVVLSKHYTEPFGTFADKVFDLTHVPHLVDPQASFQVRFTAAGDEPYVYTTAQGTVNLRPERTLASLMLTKDTATLKSSTYQTYGSYEVPALSIAHSTFKSDILFNKEYLASQGLQPGTKIAAINAFGKVAATSAPYSLNVKLHASQGEGLETTTYGVQDALWNDGNLVASLADYNVVDGTPYGMNSPDSHPLYYTDFTTPMTYDGNDLLLHYDVSLSSGDTGTIHYTEQMLQYPAEPSQAWFAYDQYAQGRYSFYNSQNIPVLQVWYEVEPTAILSGTVTDDNGAPAAGLLVKLHDATNDILYTATTAEDGTYSIPVYKSANIYSLTVSGEGYIAYTHGDAVDFPNAAPRVIDITVTTIKVYTLSWAEGTEDDITLEPTDDSYRTFTAEGIARLEPGFVVTCDGADAWGANADAMDVDLSYRMTAVSADAPEAAPVAFANDILYMADASVTFIPASGSITIFGTPYEAVYAPVADFALAGTVNGEADYEATFSWSDPSAASEPAATAFMIVSLEGENATPQGEAIPAVEGQSQYTATLTYQYDVTYTLAVVALYPGDKQSAPSTPVTLFVENPNSGIDSIAREDIDANALIFNTLGQRLYDIPAPGVYVIVSNGNAKRLFVR